MFLASNASLDLFLWTRPRKQQLVRLTLVIPLAVIMFAEVFQGAAQRAFPKQNEMGKTLALHRAHPSLREGIQIRAARRKSQALYSSGCQRLSEIRAELRIAVVQHIAMAAQISGFLVHRVAGHLGHPLLRRMARDARQAYASSFQMQEEQNVVRHQASPCQHLDGEEVGSREHVHVPAEELPPSCRLTPLGSWCDVVAA